MNPVSFSHGVDWLMISVNSGITGLCHSDFLDDADSLERSQYRIGGLLRSAVAPSLRGIGSGGLGRGMSW